MTPTGNWAELTKALRAIERWHEDEAERHEEAAEAVDPTAAANDQHEADLHDNDAETHRVAAALIRDAIADPAALIAGLAAGLET